MIHILFFFHDQDRKNIWTQFHFLFHDQDRKNLMIHLLFSLHDQETAFSVSPRKAVTAFR